MTKSNQLNTFFGSLFELVTPIYKFLKKIFKKISFTYLCHDEADTVCFTDLGKLNLLMRVRF
jgi:hypothetical protein